MHTARLLTGVGGGGCCPGGVGGAVFLKNVSKKLKTFEGFVYLWSQAINFVNE